MDSLFPLWALSYRRRKRLLALFCTLRRERKSVLWCAAFVALLMGLLHIADNALAEGPRCHGRYLSEWVDILASDRTSNTGHFEAEEAIAQIGASAFPYLIKWIQLESQPWYSKLPPSVRDCLVDYDGPRFWLAAPSPRERRASGAEIAFGQLKFKITPSVIKELTRLMNSPKTPQTGRRATYILGQLGPAGVAALADVVKTPLHPRREEALLMLISLTSEKSVPSPEILVPALIQCLDDTPRPMPWMIANALGNLKSSPQQTVPALVSCLEKPDPALRRAAASALGNLSSLPQQTIPALESCLERPDPELRRAAAISLIRLIPEGWVSGVTLTNLLQDPDPGIRRAANRALTGPKKKGRSSRP
jgi:hypothetical protein